MPSEITVPKPTLSFKKAPNTYLADIISLSPYDLEKGTKLDVFKSPFNYADALFFNKPTPLIPKESKAYNLKQLFASLKIFTTPASAVEIIEEKPPLLPVADLTQVDTPPDLPAFTEERPAYFPIKTMYLLSFEKIRNCKGRPIVDILLIHQTMSRLQRSGLLYEVHPAIIERRIIEKAAFLRKLNKARYPQIISAPLKQQYTPPPPYFRFDNESKDTGAERKCDDEHVPLAVIQSEFQHTKSNRD
ncbi:hypothetical protein K493DRAFT_318247 [Basidiobolus meristosporus CBS 931.73]|uniref:Uncharacterized protein n=1 Tax=Basidiobolus meristosporus CBS 931.73 TaxID=1314790 RepID=A0A1Y1XWC4_9FUNG|nr:hypothetical protein K493DRAFT_318247 [Basidiobolus meristosporus CBS 931.73]|eukprot:ORX90028.1 hypothetical protein K493DRAFT_318247 [Basidiobolus meristosporus CBS 931.73]